MPQIIGLSGKQHAGKDQVAQLLIEWFPQYVQRPIARAIKARYAKIHGLSLAEIEERKAQYRPDLIALGDWGRAQDPDFWLKALLAEADTQAMIVSDVRLPREVSLLKENDAYLIRVEASRSVRAERGTLVAETDPTECSLDDYADWDATLTNNGSLADLAAQVDRLFL